MSPYPFTLVDFIRESNRIEGIHREPTQAEIAELTRFLALDRVTVEDMQAFVTVYQPNAVLRDRRGLNVRVGNHIAPPGGAKIVQELEALLATTNKRRLLDPYTAHCEYEMLHPFTDGNGRSGRALWLWMMGGIDRAPLGFLHSWYYASLRDWRAA